MRAAVYTRYGPPEVVEVKSVEKPSPADNEVLIKTYATTVTTGDWRVRSLNLPSGFGMFGRLIFGISGPRQKILGTELAGMVESVGKNVTKFKVGDRVFVFCGANMGCHAEYKCMKEDGPIALKPNNLTFEEAAGLSFGGATALHFLKKADLQRGEKVLVTGASGGVGSAMVQIAAKHFGADVTGVCSTHNLEFVKSLGAAHAIDYTTQNFTENGVAYDVIVDVSGTAPFHLCKNSLTDKGRLVLVLSGLSALLSIPWISMTSSRRVIAGPAPESAEILLELAKLAEEGRFRPVIGSRFAFEEIVQAHRLVDTGHKRGNVVVRLVDEEPAPAADS
jgi:NADPH:quinone reductase-like Zn-dependent oxidoreductase